MTWINSKTIFVWLSVTTSTLFGCTNTVTSRPILNPQGTASTYRSSDTSSVVTLNTEARDIDAIASKMARSMLQIPSISNADVPARIIIDEKYIRNTSGETFNRSLITNKIQVAVGRASRGRITILSDTDTSTIESARTQKRSGGYDSGSLGLSKNRISADYRLTGEIASLRQATSQGAQSNFVVFTFRVLDLESGATVWLDEYDFIKEGQNSLLYR